MPLLRPSPSDYTTMVKALANAGAAVTNPQGFRPPSKSSVAFVNVASVAAIIRASSFSFIPPRVVAPAPFVPPVVNPLATRGGGDGFVVKYNSDGIPLWARRMGGISSDQVNSVSVDSSGNVVVAGQYTADGTIIFAADGTTAFTTLANNGNNDGFVVKYDSTGTPLWVRRIGANSGSDIANSVNTDSSGNIVVAGQYNFNPLNIYLADGTTSFTTLTNSGSNDGFVVKYDSAGTPQWVRRLSGTSSDIANSVNTDSSGNIVVAGGYSSNPLTIYLADGIAYFTTLTNLGGNDVFVVKYDSAGTPLWARTIGGTGADIANSVSIDSAGNIVVTGQYGSNPLTIFAADGATSFTTLTNSGNNDVFVVKYDSAGTPLWARRLGGTADDRSTSVRVDSSGNIVVAGRYFSNPLTIFATDGTTEFATLSNSGNFDSFVVKYDSTGTPLWARRLGGTGDEYANSVNTDSSGNIVVAGYYASNPLTIFAADGSTTFTTLANAGGFGAFVVKYDSAGTPLWARRLDGTGGESANSVSIDSSGNIVVAGNYSSNPLTIT